MCQKCDASVNYGHPSNICEGLPNGDRNVYGKGVPRTDENGRQLKALLGYLLDGEIDAKEIYDALGVSSSTYYRRITEGDYPNARERRLVADRFGLSYPDLQVRFGLMSHHEVRSYMESGPLAVATVNEATTRTRTRTRLSEMKPRSDAPPL